MLHPTRDDLPVLPVPPVGVAAVRTGSVAVSDVALTSLAAKRGKASVDET